MKKSEIAQQIAQRSGIKKTQATAVLAVLAELAETNLASNGRFTLHPLGSFKKVVRAGRKGWNPRTGGEIQIPERNTVVFTPSQQLKDRLQSE